MATQGQDASEVVRKIAAVIKARQKGVALEDAIEATFAPQQQVPPAGAPQMVEQPSPAPEGVPAGGALAPEGMPEGMPMEAQPEQAPALQSLLSSLSGAGTANASVRTVQRR
jgi:hypothetical protein